MTRHDAGDRPLVSIVLPTYNGSRYIGESLESCVAQTYGNIEVIVVDDASTDGTPGLVARHAAASDRIKSVRHERNRRLPAALNTGFALAGGDYLTWTSDDNLYEPEAIALMVGCLEARPETAMVYCDMKKIGPTGEALGIWRNDGPEVLPQGNCVGACFLYRREVYEAVGDYDESMALVEDYDYWLRVARRFPIAHLSGATPYRYRIHPASLTSRRSIEAGIRAARARCLHVVPGSQHDRVMTEAYWRAIWLYRAAGDLKSSFDCARRCLALNPSRLDCWKTTATSAVRLLLSRGRIGMAR
jgi:glycosyltransferase involved in cell wall biosynthesis